MIPKYTMARFKIRIQSISDIITNSSSETFVIKDNNSFSKEIIQSNLETIRDNSTFWKADFSSFREFLEKTTSTERAKKYISYSGDGGTIKVEDWTDMYKKYKEDWIPEKKRHRFTPEIWSLTEEEELDVLKKTLWITVDEDFYTVIDHILKNFHITEKDCWSYLLSEKDPDTGRILRKVSQDEYQNLPEERKAFNNWD